MSSKASQTQKNQPELASALQKVRSGFPFDITIYKRLIYDLRFTTHTHQLDPVYEVWLPHAGRSVKLVLGEDPAARSHRVEQFTAL